VERAVGGVVAEHEHVGGLGRDVGGVEHGPVGGVALLDRDVNRGRVQVADNDRVGQGRGVVVHVDAVVLAADVGLVGHRLAALVVRDAHAVDADQRAGTGLDEHALVVRPGALVDVVALAEQLALGAVVAVRVRVGVGVGVAVGIRVGVGVARAVVVALEVGLGRLAAREREQRRDARNRQRRAVDHGPSPFARSRRGGAPGRT